MPSINLSKGGKINLAKEAAGMTQCSIGLGWDEKPNAVAGAEFDPDVSVLLLHEGGKAKSDSDFIFYNNLVSPDGEQGGPDGQKTVVRPGYITHWGDNRTGSGDGDDETIDIDLARIPADVSKIVVLVTIYGAPQNGQNFGMMDNSYVRLVDKRGDKEVLKFELDFDASNAYGVQFASLIKRGTEWVFSADQTVFEGGLEGALQTYGLGHEVK